MLNDGQWWFNFCTCANDIPSLTPRLGKQICYSWILQSTSVLCPGFILLSPGFSKALTSILVFLERNRFLISLHMYVSMYVITVDILRQIYKHVFRNRNVSILHMLNVRSNFLEVNSSLVLLAFMTMQESTVPSQVQGQRTQYSPQQRGTVRKIGSKQRSAAGG